MNRTCHDLEEVVNGVEDNPKDDGIREVLAEVIKQANALKIQEVTCLIRAQPADATKSDRQEWTFEPKSQTIDVLVQAISDRLDRSPGPGFVGRIYIEYKGKLDEGKARARNLGNFQRQVMPAKVSAEQAVYNPSVIYQYLEGTVAPTIDIALRPIQAASAMLCENMRECSRLYKSMNTVQSTNQGNPQLLTLLGQALTYAGADQKSSNMFQTAMRQPIPQRQPQHQFAPQPQSQFAPPSLPGPHLINGSQAPPIMQQASPVAQLPAPPGQGNNQALTQEQVKQWASDNPDLARAMVMDFMQNGDS